jgi:hypothetical protein
MPNRMLRDWTDSRKFDGISADAERLFLRLIMKADDYGRFHGDCRLIKSACFPLMDTLRANELNRWLKELSDRQLILCYEVHGRSIIAIVNFGQRLKQSRAKFPQPEGKNSDFLPTDGYFQEVPGSSGKFLLEEKGREVEEEYEEEDEEKGHNEPKLNLVSSSEPQAASSGPHVPTLVQAKSFAPQAGVDPEIAETWWHEMEGTGWVDRNGKPVVRWQNLLTSYGRKWASNENRYRNGSKKTPKPSKWDNAW